MSRPRLLDLYCGAGGASAGYERAGFDVVGVDLAPMPNYPGEFVRADALEVLADAGFVAGFDALAASPPCQSYTPLRALDRTKVYPDLVAATRAALDATGLPWIMENVMAAPLLRRHSVVLCGSMFGLRTYRHRRFEPSPDLHLVAPRHPRHTARTATVERRARWEAGWHVSITGDVGTYVGPEAMGIDWMTGDELSQAIPPAYTACLGRQLLARLGLAA